MSLIWKLRRRFGHDPVREIVHEEPLYRFHIEHLNGDVTEAFANRKVRDEGFLLLMKKDRDTWANVTFYSCMEYTGAPASSLNQAYDTIHELEGIKSVEQERVGTDTVVLHHDRADDIWWDEERYIQLTDDSLAGDFENSDFSEGVLEVV